MPNQYLSTNMRYLYLKISFLHSPVIHLIGLDIFFHYNNSDEEVVEFLKAFSEKVGIYFYVENLKYLRRGGRISAASAVMGTLLNIKPILTVTNEGKLEKLTTVKGNKKAIDFLYEKFNKEYYLRPKYILKMATQINSLIKFKTYYDTFIKFLRKN